MVDVLLGIIFREPNCWPASIIPWKALGMGKYNLVFLTIDDISE